jgi:hypothetical protein
MEQPINEVERLVVFDAELQKTLVKLREKGYVSSFRDGSWMITTLGREFGLVAFVAI